MKDSLRDTVRQFIEEQKLLKKGDRVIVALSGGADSVALLHICCSLKEKYDLSLVAAHFHHGIRGAEADRDADFVKELCKRWNVELHMEQADVPAVAAQTGESLELCGRNLRYRFLKNVARDFGGAKIATAHHADDNAETVLWNLTRGAGFAGLSGIPVQRENIIRPLLCLTRCGIEAYCRENDLPFMTDSTNLSDDYTRNKLRHQVMPVLRELNPNVSVHVARTAALMHEAEEYFNKISAEELKRAAVTHGYSCAKLLSLDPIVCRYAVKQLLTAAGAAVDYAHILLIIEAMHSGTAVDLPGGCTADCSQGTLRIIHAADAPAADDFCFPFAQYAARHGIRVRISGGKPEPAAPFAHGGNGEKINKLLLNDAIPCDIITRDTVIRHRRAGDTFTDARRGVTKTLKKLLNELKIPREKRDTLLVAADGSAVLWLEGYGASSRMKADLPRDGEYIILMGDRYA